MSRFDFSEVVHSQIAGVHFVGTCDATCETLLLRVRKEKGALVLFERSMGKAAFISHQWVGESHPDPEFRQMSVLQDALRQDRLIRAFSGSCR